jgi:hypothetical protein
MEKEEDDVELLPLNPIKSDSGVRKNHGARTDKNNGNIPLDWMVVPFIWRLILFFLWIPSPIFIFLVSASFLGAAIPIFINEGHLHDPIPYVSDLGQQPSERYIFIIGLVLILGSYLRMVIQLCLQLEKSMQRLNTDKGRWINTTSLLAAVVTCMSGLVVATVPSTEEKDVHGIATAITLLFLVIWELLLLYCKSVYPLTSDKLLERRWLLFRGGLCVVIFLSLVYLCVVGEFYSGTREENVGGPSSEYVILFLALVLLLTWLRDLL